MVADALQAACFKGGGSDQEKFYGFGSTVPPPDPLLPALRGRTGQDLPLVRGDLSWHLEHGGTSLDDGRFDPGVDVVEIARQVEIC